MIKQLPRFTFCLLGLAGFGIIIAEILKKWQIINTSLSTVWIIIPILGLYVIKEVTNSPFIRNSSNLSPNLVNTSVKIINVILIIISILAWFSIPFLWFGTIEELAKQ